jgi:hypothetical protein
VASPLDANTCPVPLVVDGGSELLTEFWPNRRSTFSRRAPCSATSSNNRSINSRAGSPPPNAICSASSRRSSTLHNYAPTDKNSCKPTRDLNAYPLTGPPSRPLAHRQHKYGFLSPRSTRELATCTSLYRRSVK